jgi:putative SOS response-associated peptidase YedK
MCGRTSLFVPQAAVEARFDAMAVDPLSPRYNIAPREDLAVVRNDEPAEIRLHEWGLVPQWADDPGETRFINARAGTVEEKPSFADAAANRRCLVLADGFYEWRERRGDPRPYRIEREDGDPFAMAGLWGRCNPGGGDPLTTVTVVTTEPNEVVAPLHERMAVVLGPDEERAWLDAADPVDRAALLDTPAPDDFRAYPVSSRVNDPANDDPSVVERVDPEVQTGLDEF